MQSTVGTPARLSGSTRRRTRVTDGNATAADGADNDEADGAAAADRPPSPPSFFSSSSSSNPPVPSLAAPSCRFITTTAPPPRVEGGGGRSGRNTAAASAECVATKVPSLAPYACDDDVDDDGEEEEEERAEREEEEDQRVGHSDPSVKTDDRYLFWWMFYHHSRNLTSFFGIKITIALGQVEGRRAMQPRLCFLHFSPPATCPTTIIISIPKKDVKFRLRCSNLDQKKKKPVVAFDRLECPAFGYFPVHVLFVTRF